MQVQDSPWRSCVMGLPIPRPLLLSRRQRHSAILERSGAAQLSETPPKLLILWWAQQDSNLRLPPCESIHAQLIDGKAVIDRQNPQNRPNRRCLPPTFPTP